MSTKSVVKASAALGSFKTPQRIATGTSTSPACFTPAVLKSVHVNDDEAERRQRRLAAHMQLVMSPGCHTPRDLVADCQRTQQTEGTSTAFSNAQIAEHYASCIKLSSENKISAKNAFGLHLIDYMAEMLRKRGEMMNFQVAGCTLDASAKIYAGRVDSIYNDAFKMLGGLGWNDFQDQDGNEENKDESDALKEKPQRKKKNTSAAVQCIEKNPASLNISSSDSDFDVDPLYRHPFSAFDEGGVGSLLLNQLCVKDDLCALLLDASCVFNGDTSLLEYQNLGNQDVRGIKLQANFHCLEICESLATFCFDPKVSGDGKDFGNAFKYEDQQCKDTLKDSYLEFSTEYSMLQHNTMSEPTCDFQDEPEPLCANDVDDVTLEAFDDDEAIAVGGDTKMVDNDPGTLQMNERELCLSEALAPSEYSYLDPTVLSTWAGPMHWRVKPKTTDGKIVDDQTASKPKTRQAVQHQRIDFRTVPDDNLFCKGKAAIKLKAFTENAVRQNTLPQDAHASLGVLLTLFMRPGWQISHHGNHNDGPKDTVEIVELQEDLDYESLEDNDSITHSELGEFAPSSMLQQQSTFGMFEQEHLLVEVPKKVEQIHIDYAHSAKQVDVKRLKREMWSILESHPDASLEVICHKLPVNMPTSYVHHLSIPICFVCLLHLANEKGLTLHGNELLNNCNVQIC